MSFSALVVVGNENGIVGVGMGKQTKYQKQSVKALKMQRKI